MIQGRVTNKSNVQVELDRPWVWSHINTTLLRPIPNGADTCSIIDRSTVQGVIESDLCTIHI